jgi:hypothetical protein
MTVRKWEFGSGSSEVGSWNAEVGSWNVEVGMRKWELFDCGFRIADFGLNSLMTDI